MDFEIMDAITGQINIFYEKLKNGSGTVGELELKIKTLVNQVSWRNQPYAKVVEKGMAELLEKDKGCLPLRQEINH